MADQTIPVVDLRTRDVASAAITVATVTSSNEGILTPVSDEMALVLLDPGGGCVVTIEHGDGPLGVLGDLEVTLTAGQLKAVQLQTARFKVLDTTSGDVGLIRMTVDNDVSVYALRLH